MMVEVANGDDPDLVSDRLRVFGAVGVEIRDDVVVGAFTDAAAANAAAVDLAVDASPWATRPGSTSGATMPWSSTPGPSPSAHPGSMLVQVSTWLLIPAMPSAAEAIRHTTGPRPARRSGRPRHQRRRSRRRKRCARHCSRFARRRGHHR